ncbi:hypothetical protein HRR93_007952 [Exophiala dermatitidis]|nr:hypothetical protein HRR93_007952 [Exophiala dermatitidis]
MQPTLLADVPRQRVHLLGKISILNGTPLLAWDLTCCHPGVSLSKFPTCRTASSWLLARRHIVAMTTSLTVEHTPRNREQNDKAIIAEVETHDDLGATIVCICKKAGHDD